jgi:hypothetical protein
MRSGNSGSAQRRSKSGTSQPGQQGSEAADSHGKYHAPALQNATRFAEGGGPFSGLGQVIERSHEKNRLYARIAVLFRHRSRNHAGARF